MSYIKFCYAVLMQTLLIGSIYVIYFQSTVIEGLEAVPQEPLRKPSPAKRLVIFSVDNLRANEFFENHCNNVPHLRQLFLRQGLVGIIPNCSIGNESKDSYMSIFSGFYQDPALVRHVPFDTIFNHTARSYAWSSQTLDHLPHINHPKIVKIEKSFEAKKHSYRLDEAVFESFKQFLSKPSHSHPIKNYSPIIYLIHLVGLQLAEDWKSYRENLNYTDIDISKIYQRFEETFPDQRTAYLLVSNSGCHGRATKNYIETPVFIWGSGVAHFKYMLGRNFWADDQKLPLHIFDYIQLTPLISALLGIPPPVNNRGILPRGLLNTNTRYEAYAMRMNSFQLLAQAKHLVIHHRRGLLSDILPKFWLTTNMMDRFNATTRLLSLQHRFNTLLEHTANYMPVFLKCIDYYQLYYQRLMLMATICGLLGWLYNLQCHLGSQSKELPLRTSSLYFLIFKEFILLISFLMVAFVIIQRVPWLDLYALLLPIFMWILALRVHEKRMKSNVSYRKFFWPIVLALCCVVGFNRRHFFGLTYLGFALYNNRKAFRSRNLELYLWLLLVFGLAGISYLPPSLGCHQRNLLLASIPLTFLRPLAFGIKYNRKPWICNGLVLLAAFIHVLYRPAAWIMNITSWIYLIYVFIRHPSPSSIELIFNFSTLYTLLCTSYETLVIQLLATELNLGLRLKLKNVVNIPESSSAIYIMIYSCYSFFVLGNISAVEYIQQYLDYTCFGNLSQISALVIGIKLMLPSVMLLYVFDSNCKDHIRDRRKVFHWLLFMCNTMAMVFLIRNRNQSTWQEISVNVTNFLIIQLWPLIVTVQRSVPQFMCLRYQPELPKCKSTT